MIQQFYSKLSDKEKKVFYFAAGAVVLALFDLLFLGPVTSNLKRINEEITEKENNLKRDLRLLSYKDRIWAEREALGPYYNTEVMTPDQVKASFLQKIEMLATESKVNLTKVAPAGEERQKSFVKYLADLECTGTLEDIVKFMHLIDSTQELLKIVKVNIISKQSAKDVSVTMTVVKIIFDPRAVWTESELAQRTGGQATIRPGSGGSGNIGSGASGATAGAGAGGSGGGGISGAGGATDAGGADAGASGTSDTGSGVSGSGGGGAPSAGEGIGGGTGGGTTSGSGTGGLGSASASSRSAGRSGGQDFQVGKNIQSSETASSGTVDKEPPKPEEEKKSAFPVPSGGGRAQTSSLVDLWNQFWGIKPKEPPPVDVSTADINWEEVQEEENKPNLWERLGK